MTDLFEDIYKVFGQDTPNRIIYNATVASPTSTATILKKFKKWKDFEKAYTIFCGSKREGAPLVTKPAAKAAVTKEVPEVVKK